MKKVELKCPILDNNLTCPFLKLFIARLSQMFYDDILQPKVKYKIKISQIQLICRLIAGMVYYWKRRESYLY
jgi:hypothetical protein